MAATAKKARNKKKEWTFTAQECAYDSFEECFATPRMISCISDGVVAVCNNRPYAGFPDLRDQELAWIRERLSKAGIRELAFANFPEPGHRVAGYTYALLLKASRDQWEFIEQVVEQAARRSEEYIVRGRFDLRSLAQVKTDGLWPAHVEDTLLESMVADVLMCVPEHAYAKLKELGVKWSLPGMPAQVGSNVIRLPAELERRIRWEIPFAVIAYIVCRLTTMPGAAHEEIMAAISGWGFKDEVDVFQRLLDEGWPDWAVQLLRKPA